MTDHKPPSATALASADTLFEDLAERVAQARTKALMGDQDEARQLLETARQDYERFRESLRAWRGWWRWSIRWRRRRKR